MASVIDSLENYSIYVVMNLRGANPGFHWGICVPTAKPLVEAWHATNPSGGWFMEHKTTTNMANSLSLVYIFKIGIATSANWETVKATLNAVPAAGEPSKNTGEAFSCRVWVKDAILALHNARCIVLHKAIQTIEAEVTDFAERNRKNVEEGPNRAVVNNRTGFAEHTY